MKTSGLGELEAVLAVARHRSFRAAATELGVSTSALSHAVAALEARIGVRLFNRTTRSVSLSEAGVQFADSIAPALSTIRAAIEQVGNFRDTLSGTLRINTSTGAARQAMPLFIAFLQRYPEMKLDIVTEGRLIDIVVEGFDAGIRLAETVPRDMIAVPFGDRQRFAVVGSPTYFAQHKVPRTPADLNAHRCIRTRMQRCDLSVGVRATRRSGAYRRKGCADARRAGPDAGGGARRSRSHVCDRVDRRCRSGRGHACSRAGRLDAAARQPLPVLSGPPPCASRTARTNRHDPRAR